MDQPAGPAATAERAADILNGVDEALWVLAALDHLVRSGSLSADGLALRSEDDAAAAAVLAATGLVTGEQPPRVATGLADLVADGSLPVRHQGMISTLRQVAAATGIIPSEAADGWAGQDDETLLAQGRSSAIAGQMLAMYAVPSLDGLQERFATGGDFLDVGVGVAELAAAFCNALPLSSVVGLDVMPRALRLAEKTVAAHGLDERLELRLLPVQELADVERFDLAWMPAPFLPPDVFHLGLGRVHAALRAGGWLVLAAGRFDGDALAVAVTRWRTLRSGGTALTFEDAQAALAGAGFGELTALPTPPGAPVLYAGRKP